MRTSVPQRIVCLSAEVADWLWRLGAWHRVVGVTAWFEMPPEAASKPRISGFSSVGMDQLLALDPDLVIGFSDVQADIAAELIRQGCTVLTTNQRTLKEIEEALILIARSVGCESAAEPLLEEFRGKLFPVGVQGQRLRVYFEEWNDPLVAGIAWVGELIERAGGEDIFADLRSCGKALDRVVKPEDVLAARPQIILGSWCGNPFLPDKVAARPEWSSLPAIQHDEIYEIRAADILQPGFRLVFGYKKIIDILSNSAQSD